VNEAFLLCVIRSMQEEKEQDVNNTIQFFFILSAALVFFMQTGFAMLCAGSVRLKNVQNTMLKNLLDACGAALGFFSVGYAFAFGGTTDSAQKTFLGNTNFFMKDVDDNAGWLFQFAFAATSATIVAGTLAERCQMAAYLCYSVVLTGFVYPAVAHAIWSGQGFLTAFSSDPLWGIGMIDFAGSGVVHVTGGITALLATIILGPRRGRFHDARGAPLAKPTPMPGHSVALQVLGTFILWFGWYGFNPGSALAITNGHYGAVAALCAVNTTLAAASAGVTAIFLNLVLVERQTGEATFDIVMLMNGALAGLVAITAGCSVVTPWVAVLIGFIGGVVYLTSSKTLLWVRIDDAVDAIPVHFFNGVWGLISTGLFAKPELLMMAYDTDAHVGLFYSMQHTGSIDATLLGCQLTGTLFICGWVFMIMFPFFIWLNYVGWFRADSLEELVGLDISYHGGASGGVDEVKNEYVQAFNKQRGELRKRRKQRLETIGGPEGRPGPSGVAMPDPEAEVMDMRHANGKFQHIMSHS